VRFEELAAVTSLPIDKISHSFRNEDVLTVLPVFTDEEHYETLLVATRTTLAIVTGEVGERGGRWMSRWAAWDSVGVSDPDLPPGAEDDVYRLTVQVGGQDFSAQLPGEAGRRALRDFVVAVQRSQPTGSARS
jgi:hypothetical protein